MKRIIASLLAGLCLLALVGCSAGSKADSAAPKDYSQIIHDARTDEDNEYDMIFTKGEDGKFTAIDGYSAEYKADQLNEEIPKLEEQIAGLKTQLDTAQSKLNQLKVDPSSLPEVTLPIDDALFASCKEILAKYDPQYDANAMPANLEEAKSDLTKMAAMLASIERAQQAIETEAAALTGKSPSTLTRAAKKGTLSVKQDAQGRTVYDVSELERV